MTGGDEGSEADLLNMSVLDQTSPRGIGKLRWIGTFIGFGEKKNKGTNERTDKVTTSLFELLIAAKNLDAALHYYDMDYILTHVC